MGRWKERQTDKLTDRQTSLHTNIGIHGRQTERQMDKEISRQTDRKTEKQINRKTDIQIDGSTDRQEER